MMKTLLKYILLLANIHLYTAIAMGQEIQINQAEGSLGGTLQIPKHQKFNALLIIVAGSGPTDRNGNNPAMQNNAYKFLAEDLAKKGIASFRYDKRGVGASASLMIPEEKLLFDHFADDLNAVVDHFKASGLFKTIVLAGHSEGASLALKVALNNSAVDGLISIAGAGRPIDQIILEQLAKQSSSLRDKAKIIMDSLNTAGFANEVPIELHSILRPSIHPYMKSWMNFEPCTSIKKLQKPCLIIQGSTDLQISTTDARLLAQAQPKAQLMVIQNMTHPLKESSSTQLLDQFSTVYADPKLPLHPDLCKSIIGFVKNLSSIRQN